MADIFQQAAYFIKRKTMNKHTWTRKASNRLDNALGNLKL